MFGRTGMSMCVGRWIIKTTAKHTRTDSGGRAATDLAAGEGVREHLIASTRPWLPDDGRRAAFSPFFCEFMIVTHDGMTA